MCALILLRVSAFPNAARFPPELPSSMATLTFLGCAGLFIYQRSPYTYWLYVVFPIYFWRNVLIDLPILENVWKTMTTGASSFDAVISVVVRISLVVTAVERMVVRSVLTCAHMAPLTKLAGRVRGPLDLDIWVLRHGRAVADVQQVEFHRQEYHAGGGVGRYVSLVLVVPNTVC